MKAMPVVQPDFKAQKGRLRRSMRLLKEMSCVENVYVLYVYCHIVVACIFFNCRDLSCYLYTAVG
jgi:hypothetical protein